jgi:predicted phage-related endonuclease
MRLGTKLETPILEVFAEEHPELRVFTTGTYEHYADPWKHANLDGLFEGEHGLGVVEVKYSADFWTEVPKHYEYQVRWYMHILGLKRGVIVALCGSSYKEFWLEYDEFIEAAMLERLTEFWGCVLSHQQPEWDGSESTYQSVRQLNKDIVDNDVELGSLGSALLEMNTALADAKYDYNFYASQVLDLMGDAKNGLLNGQRICYRQNSSTGTPFLKIVKGK